MNNNIVIIVLLAIIVVLLFNLWRAVAQSRNCTEDNIKLIDNLAKHKTREENLEKILIIVTRELNFESLRMKEEQFYFEAVDRQMQNIELEAIRFKKKDNKVFTYLNGAMKPTEDLVFLKNPLLHNKELSRVVFALKSAYNSKIKPVEKLEDLIYTTK